MIVTLLALGLMQLDPGVFGRRVEGDSVLLRKAVTEPGGCDALWHRVSEPRLDALARDRALLVAGHCFQFVDGPRAPLRCQAGRAVPDSALMRAQSDAIYAYALVGPSWPFRDQAEVAMRTAEQTVDAAEALCASATSPRWLTRAWGAISGWKRPEQP